jgi:hypothetical protein
MSFRRFNPFTSNASINTRSKSARSGPPTYTSNTTPASTYLPNESTSSSHSRSEKVGVWSASLPSAWSVADSDTVIDPTEPSLTDTVCVTESSVEIAGLAGPRYGELECYPYLSSLKDQNPSVYYRVYAKDGAITTVNPVYSDDPYLGRILARRVAPPHTASSLGHCLSNVEKIGTDIQTSLFIATSSESPMDDSDRMSILAHTGPGYTAKEPVALVISSLTARKLSSRPQIDRRAEQGPMPFEIQYCELYQRCSRLLIALISCPSVLPSL